jgi:A/G-specific adenine glycosylase
MAQQTQISRVGPAWIAFLARFPTLADLAAAPTGDVLRAWAGLGYNRRALNLQRAARAVVERHGGELPREVAALEALPGIGPYTARALAAIAFGAPVGAVDTNVRRVLGRVVSAAGHPNDPGTPQSPRALQIVADEAVDPATPGEWTHAVMDLGARVCRPRPDCGSCPIRQWCAFPTIAAAPAAPRPVRTEPPVAFAMTRRWLRGRLMSLVRDGANGDWRRIDAPVGEHGADAVDDALRQLAREGLLERDGSGRVRLPA